MTELRTGELESVRRAFVNFVGQWISEGTERKVVMEASKDERGLLAVRFSVYGDSVDASDSAAVAEAKQADLVAELEAARSQELRREDGYNSGRRTADPLGPAEDREREAEPLSVEELVATYRNFEGRTPAFFTTREVGAFVKEVERLRAENLKLRSSDAELRRRITETVGQLKLAVQVMEARSHA